MTAEQFDKLPLYAQRVIEQQAEQLEALQRGVVDPSKYGTIRTRGLPDAAYSLGPGPMVRFPIQNPNPKGRFDQEFEVDVFLNRDGILEVHGHDIGRLRILPVASNSILIQNHD